MIVGFAIMETSACSAFCVTCQGPEARRCQAGTPVKPEARRRWGCEMQRRCGSKGLWEVVSFTGQVKYSLLSNVKHTPTPKPDTILKDEARQARANFRFAASLKKRGMNGGVLTEKQCEEIKQLEALRKKANKKTLKSGHGRLRNLDGTCIDIGGNTGGATRKALDGWKPPKLENSDSDDDELNA